MFTCAPVARMGCYNNPAYVAACTLFPLDTLAYFKRDTHYGSTWVDAAGPYNATAVGAVSGNAFSGGYYETGFKVADLRKEGGYTVAAWTKFTGSIGQHYAAIVGGRDPATPGSGTEWFIGKNAGNSCVGVQDGNYLFDTACGSSLFDGNYHSIVFTENSAGAGVVYVDGARVGGGSWSGGAHVDREYVTIGTEHEGGGFAWKGQIDEVAFYTKALSAADAATIATGMRTGAAIARVGTADSWCAFPEYVADPITIAPQLSVGMGSVCAVGARPPVVTEGAVFLRVGVNQLSWTGGLEPSDRTSTARQWLISKCADSQQVGGTCSTDGAGKCATRQRERSPLSAHAPPAHPPTTTPAPHPAPPLQASGRTRNGRASRDPCWRAIPSRSRAPPAARSRTAQAPRAATSPGPHPAATGARRSR